MYAVQLWLKNENEVLTRCETIYASEKGTVTKEELKAANPDYGFIDEVQEEYPEFDSIRAEIMSMLNDVRNILLDDNKSLQYGKGVHICVDNCKANKEAEEGTTLRIVYPTDEQMATMEKDPVFLVIGGNTLARGLTIDGLVCSYFSRNSNQADTLMQMARWFGYRKGFELMQRIWMTESVLKKFEALSQIDMDMKEEIEQFMERGISPELFGPRIRNIQDRPLSIKEYARIQQFPDDWIFKGTLSAKYRQIGNAVPVGLAEAIGRAIISTADKTSTIETKRFRGTSVHNRIKNAMELGGRSYGD